MNSVPESILSRKTQAVYGLLCLLLLLGLIFATRWFLAELSVNKVYSRLAVWDLTQEVGSLEEWNYALADLEQAMELNPGRADYYSSMGSLYEWRTLVNAGESLTLIDENEIRQQAIEAYRHATVLRPAWPDDWAHLARQKAILGQQDQELSLALTRALSLGANEPRVQELAIEVITLSWPFFAGNEEISRLISE